MDDEADMRTAVLCVENEGEGALSGHCLADSSYAVTRTSSYAVAAGELRRHTFDALLIAADPDRAAALGFAASARRRDPNLPILVHARDVDEAWHRTAARAGATVVLDTARLTRGEIAHLVARCIADTELRNLAALAAEMVAIGEHLSEAGEEKVRPAYTQAVALDAYLAAGGTRAGFRRSWAAVVANPGQTYH